MSAAGKGRRQAGTGVILAYLVAGSVAAGGWLWGLKWKRVADGIELTVDEETMVQLYRQIDLLTEENRRLGDELDALREEMAGDGEAAELGAVSDAREARREGGRGAGSER